MDMQRSEDSLQKGILFFNLVGLGNQTQVSRLGSKCFPLLSQLTTPSLLIFIFDFTVHILKYLVFMRTLLLIGKLERQFIFNYLKMLK